MKKLLLAVLLIVPASYLSAEAPKPIKPWTVMVYLNGDNDLEEESIAQFLDMARVGSSDDVNVVVQFDRGGHLPDKYDGWSTAYRFYLTAGMTPLPGQAKESLGEINMGDGATLRNFIEWSMSEYSAEKYFLIVWDHGDVATRPLIQSQRISRRKSSSATLKWISHDQGSQDKLYNSEIEAQLGRLPKRLNVVGYDACLMGTLENAYTLRNISDFMVASEEEELAPGWSYSTLLAWINSHPEATPRELAIATVQIYGKMKTDSGREEGTLSAVDISSIEGVAADLCSTVATIEADVGLEKSFIRGARSLRKCDEYGKFGKRGYTVDFIRFLENYSKETQNTEIRSRAVELISSLRSSIVANYCGADRSGDTAFGSNGISIYFPETASIFQRDRDSQLFYDSRTDACSFVKDLSWDNLLLKYWYYSPRDPKIPTPCAFNSR